MLANFFKHYSKTKAADAGDAIVGLAVKWDADGVAETAIAQKNEEHDRMLEVLAQIQAQADIEIQELHDAQTLQNKRMAAAERAQTALASDPNNANAQQALDELLTLMEKDAPRLAKEQADVDRITIELNNMNEASEQCASELMQLRQLLDDQKRDMREADADLARNKKAAERAAVAAGIQKSQNKFDVAINALKGESDAKKVENRALELKAKQLTPAKGSSAVDAFMVDEPTPKLSAAERLANLKK